MRSWCANRHQGFCKLTMSQDATRARTFIQPYLLKSLSNPPPPCPKGQGGAATLSPLCLKPLEFVFLARHPGRQLVSVLRIRGGEILVFTDTIGPSNYSTNKCIHKKGEKQGTEIQILVVLIQTRTVASQEIETGEQKLQTGFGQFLPLYFRNTLAGSAENLRNRFLLQKLQASFAQKLAGWVLTSLVCARNTLARCRVRHHHMIECIH